MNLLLVIAVCVMLVVLWAQLAEVAEARRQAREYEEFCRRLREERLLAFDWPERERAA